MTNTGTCSVTMADKEVNLYFGPTAVKKIQSIEIDTRFYKNVLINSQDSQTYTGWAMATILFYGFHDYCVRFELKPEHTFKEFQAYVDDLIATYRVDEVLRPVIAFFEDSPSLRPPVLPGEPLSVLQQIRLNSMRNRYAS